MNYYSYATLENSVSRETREALRYYATVLQKWQNTINLVSKDSLNTLAKRHFLDSWQLISLFPCNVSTHLDLGSGGGFPGLIIAIAFHYELQKTLRTFLIESDKRKAVFLRKVVRDLELKNTHVIAKRVEELKEPQADIFTARAFTSLDQCLAITKHLRKDNSYFILPKGVNVRDEIKKARQNWSFELQSNASITDAHASILTLTQVKEIE